MSDLREYIGRIADSGQLRVVSREVSTEYEVAGLTAKADGSDAVLFENVGNGGFRLVSNLVGSRRRFALAVGDNDIHGRMISAIKDARSPETVPDGAFMENAARDIHRLPIVRHFEKESGPFITLSLIHI